MFWNKTSREPDLVCDDILTIADYALACGKKSEESAGRIWSEREREAWLAVRNRANPTSVNMTELIHKMLQMRYWVVPMSEILTLSRVRGRSNAAHLNDDELDLAVTRAWKYPDYQAILDLIEACPKAKPRIRGLVRNELFDVANPGAYYSLLRQSGVTNTLTKLSNELNFRLELVSWLRGQEVDEKTLKALAFYVSIGIPLDEKTRETAIFVALRTPELYYDTRMHIAECLALQRPEKTLTSDEILLVLDARARDSETSPFEAFAKLP